MAGPAADLGMSPGQIVPMTGLAAREVSPQRCIDVIRVSHGGSPSRTVVRETGMTGLTRDVGEAAQVVVAVTKFAGGRVAGEGVHHVLSVAGVGVPVRNPELRRFVLQIARMTLLTGEMSRRRLVQLGPVTRLAGCNVREGDRAMGRPRHPAWLVGVRLMTRVAPRSIGDPRGRGEIGSMTACGGARRA